MPEVLEALETTRAIRRYRDDPVPNTDLRDMLFAATRAPSGSNRQPGRFIILTDGENAQAAKALIGEAARRTWAGKSSREGYRSGSGLDSSSKKARISKTMAEYVENFERVPVLILACLLRYRAPAPIEGGSVYPACQNLLVAARALGYGGVMTGFHGQVDRELRALLDVPADAAIMATITLGRPRGRHGPVRRRPLGEVVFEERWGEAPGWAVDPPGAEHAGGPPVGAA
jgi:nitroreductase